MPTKRINWAVRVAVGVVGLALLLAGFWSSGAYPAGLRSAEPEVTTTVVVKGGATERTVVSKTLPDAPALADAAALSVMGVGILLLLVAIAWDRVRKVTGPGDWGLEIAEGAMVQQAVKAARETQAPEGAKVTVPEVLIQLFAADEPAQQARKELRQAADLDRQGRASEARKVRQEALSALGQLDVVAERLDQHRARYSGMERDIRSADLLRQAADWARETKPDKEDVRRMVADAPLDQRVIAISQMLGNPASADISILIDVLRHPQSAEELRLALRTTQVVIPDLDQAGRDSLEEALERLQADAIAKGDAYTPLFTRTQLRDLRRLKPAS